MSAPSAMATTKVGIDRSLRRQTFDSLQSVPPARALPRLLPANDSPHGPGLAAHLERHGRPPVLTPRDLPTLVREVLGSGLTGRGGGGFPTGRKLAAMPTGRRRPVVVVNASESEPASAKDAVLVTVAPHLVLDGAALVAAALGAHRLVVAAHGPTALPLRRAAAERASAGLDLVAAQVIELPGRFVAGEESAVVRFVNGGLPLPTTKPPRPIERGVEGRPTFVSNAETFAHLALVARHGAAWFRGLGTPEEPGSALVTLRGAVRRPGVYEVELGTSLETILASAGGTTEPVQAFLVGGYAGVLVPAAAREGLTWSRAGLAPASARPGAGLLLAIPERVCALAEVARLARFLADQSAGQCGPCAYGLPALAAALAQLLHGPRDPGLVGRIHRWLGDVEGRGACAHPDATARLLRSALTTAADEVAAHVAGSCRASEPSRSVLALEKVTR